MACPVACQIESLPGVAPSDLRLVDRETGAPVPLQARTGASGALALAWVVASMQPFTQRVYEIVTGDQGGGAHENVALSETTSGELQVQIGGEHFTTYHFGPGVVRPYLHPVLAPGGAGLTRNWPMVADVPGETHDHPHHTGLYTAHGEVNGVDNWSLAQGHGHIVHRRFTAVTGGPVVGGFVQELDWTDGERRTVLSETRRVQFYRAAPHLGLFDWEVALHASEGEVVLGDTKEAGLISVRVATSMDVENGGSIENGYGARQEAETWGRRAPWCDYSGPVGDGWWGICLMDHVENPRHPTFWHVRDYGLMTANCFGLHHFTGNPDDRWDLAHSRRGVAHLALPGSDPPGRCRTGPGRAALPRLRAPASGAGLPTGLGDGSTPSPQPDAALRQRAGTAIRSAAQRLAASPEQGVG